MSSSQIYEDSSLECHPADIDFDEVSGAVRAPTMGDIYYSVADGLEEARTVFLQGTGLPNRWQEGVSFTVAELGFGTGVNILALIDLWRKHGPTSGWLHIISVEHRPVEASQAARSLYQWSETRDIAKILVQNWPPRWKGTHRRRIDEYRVTLTILHDEVSRALEQADFLADAWFLDGFAPAKNPQMWSAQVLELVAEKSAEGALLASYTVAGRVRRALTDAGFNVIKKEGYGTKRHRLEATYTRPVTPSRSPWRLGAKDGPVLILGGGIAAVSVAHALLARKRDVTLIACGGLAAGASGAPRGLLNPQLENQNRPHLRALLAAFAYSRSLLEQHSLFCAEGVLRLARTPKKQERLRILADRLGSMLVPISGEEASACTQSIVGMAGIMVTQAGYLSPKRVVHLLAEGAKLIDAQGEYIEHHAGQWIVRDTSGKILAEAPTLVLAGGSHLAKLQQQSTEQMFVNQTSMDRGRGRFHDLSSRAMGSALADLRAAQLRYDGGWLAEYRYSDPPRFSSAIAWGNYLIPGINRHTGQSTIVMGATHSNQMDPGDIEAAKDALQQGLLEVSPMLSAQLRTPCNMWSGVRVAASDRLPLAGAVGGHDAGLVVLTGLGSRGFTHAPLLGEMIAGDLTGAPAALEKGALQAFHPRRFNRDDNFTGIPQ